MAKATLIEIFNQIQRNLGEAESGGLLNLTGMNYLIFTTLNKEMQDLANDYYWSSLETDISIPVVAGTSSYDFVNGTNALDLYAWDKDSFNYNNSYPLKPFTFKSFDFNYPTKTASGAPLLFYRWKDKINVYPIPDASQAGKVITGRGWSVPTPFSTNTATMTCWVPGMFDTCLLADIVTYKILAYRGNPEWKLYYERAYGSANEEGAIDQMKRLFGSPDISDKNLVVEPMENRTTGNQQFIQGNISG